MINRLCKLNKSLNKNVTQCGTNKHNNMTSSSRFTKILKEMNNEKHSNREIDSKMHTSNLKNLKIIYHTHVLYSRFQTNHLINALFDICLISEKITFMMVEIYAVAFFFSTSFSIRSAAS